MILTQQLNVNATKNLAKGAYRYLGRETNYSDLKARIARLSYLYLHEIGDHARVAFIANNSPCYLASFFALTNTRSVTIPIDPNASPEDWAGCLKETGATHVAVTNDMYSRVRDALQAAHLNLPVIEIEKKQGGEYASSFTPPPDNPPADTDPVVLFRTAGTIGKPKYINLNHKQLLHAAVALKSPYRLNSVDRIFTPISWSHPFSFVHGMLFPMLQGATCVIGHGAEGKDLLDFMVESRISRMAVFPPFLLKTLLVCRDEKRRIPAAVKSVTVGLGHLSAELKKAMALMDVTVAHCYGMAEAGWTLAMEKAYKEESAPAPGRRRKVGGAQEEPEIPEDLSGLYPGTPVGGGLPGLKYKVLDPSGDEIPGKEAREGLLAVTGPCVMTGYYENEKETKLAIRGTWLYTGEYARLEGDGDELKVTFLGRRDDVLPAGGNQVSIPDPLDKALRGLKGVQDAAGFVLKNSKGENKFVCAVVRAPGSILSEKQIIDYCGSNVSGDLVPAAAVFTDFIKRDAGGNVIRARLRAQFSGALG